MSKPISRYICIVENRDMRFVSYRPPTGNRMRQSSSINYFFVFTIIIDTSYEPPLYLLTNTRFHSNTVVRNHLGNTN